MSSLDEVVFIVQEAEDGGYVAVSHRYGIFTQGEDRDDLRAMVIEAVDCRFEEEPVRPHRIRLHFVRDEIIAA